MPMNRVQFQKGLSLPEFMDRCETEQTCEQALVARWPGGFVCPSCGVMQARTSFRREGRLYRQCAVCQYQCSVTSGTVFEATKPPLTRWFLVMQLLTQAKSNVSALELTRQLGASHRTAWLIRHKLLQAMALAESDRHLSRNRTEDGRVHAVAPTVLIWKPRVESRRLSAGTLRWRCRSS